MACLACICSTSQTLHFSKWHDAKLSQRLEEINSNKIRPRSRDCQFRDIVRRLRPEPRKSRADLTNTIFREIPNRAAHLCFSEYRANVRARKFLPAPNSIKQE